MTCKALTDILFDGDVAQGGYGARFAGVVFPGETLKANVWKDDARYIAGGTCAGRRRGAHRCGAEPGLNRAHAPTRVSGSGSSIARSQSTVRRIPSVSSTFARQPSSLAALSEFSAIADSASP